MTFGNMLAEHHPEGPLCCCLRPLPCPIERAVEQRMNRDRALRDSLTAPTVVLPTVSPAGKRTVRHRAEQLGWMRRLRAARRLPGPLASTPAPGLRAGWGVTPAPPRRL